MEQAGQRKVAPFLVDLEVEIEIRPFHASERVGRLGSGPDRRYVGEIEQRLAAYVVGAERDRHAVAQLLGVGEDVDASRGSISVVYLPLVVGLVDIPGVRERRGTAHGKARPLDKSSVEGGRLSDVRERRVDTEVGAQR